MNNNTINTECSLFLTRILLIIIVCDISLTEVPTDTPNLSNLDRQCMRCLCYAATECNLTSGCNGGYCGPFRISRLYWKDAGEVILPDDDIERAEAFVDCAINYHCAQKIVSSYLVKFGMDCDENGVTDCNDFSMIHFNGGYECQTSLHKKEFRQAWLKRYHACNPDL